LVCATCPSLTKRAYYAGTRLAVVRRDNSIQTYDALRIDCQVSPTQCVYVHEEMNYGCAATFSPDSQQLAFTTATGSIYVGEVRIKHASARTTACEKAKTAYVCVASRESNCRSVG
jgi:hypothetical protein